MIRELVGQAKQMTTGGLEPQGLRQEGLYFGPRLFGAEGVAKALGLPLATVKRMARDGEIPSVRIGGRLRFNLEAVGQVLSDKAAGDFAPKGR